MLSRDFVKRKRLDDLLTSQWRREHLKNKLNEEMIKQAFEEGKRPVQIAEQYNLNYATVYAILRKEGWTKDHIAAKHRWIKTRINNANRDAQLSKFYKTGNYSLEEIGSRYGLTRERVRRIVNSPNCHARVHYGHDGDQFNATLIERLGEFEADN